VGQAAPAPAVRIKRPTCWYPNVSELTHAAARKRMPELRCSEETVASLTTVTEQPGPWASKPGRSVCGATVSSSPANTARLAGRATVESADLPALLANMVRAWYWTGPATVGCTWLSKLEGNVAASGHYGD
jgi:hypothetical protein